MAGKSRKGSSEVDCLVGQRIRAARLQARLTQQQLADALGLTFQQLQKYEKGDNRVGPARLKIIAAQTRTSVSWLLSEDEQKPGCDLITQMLALPYGAELARDFIAIASNKDRHAIAEIARTVANLHGNAAGIERAA